MLFSSKQMIVQQSNDMGTYSKNTNHLYFVVGTAQCGFSCVCVSSNKVYGSHSSDESSKKILHRQTALSSP